MQLWSQSACGLSLLNAAIECIGGLELTVRSSQRRNFAVYVIKNGEKKMSNIEIDFGNDGFKIQAELKMDGDQWCVGVGLDLQQGLYAFADTPAQAIEDFKAEFRNYRKPEPIARELFAGTNEALDSLTTRT